MRTVGHENASHVIRLKNAIAYRIRKKMFINIRPNDELSLLSDN